MPDIINMPRLSDTMEEGTVAKWFKKVGDMVKEGDILAEIETDKATMEFEAFHEGELLHIGVNEGETALVDSLLAIIGEKGEDISTYVNYDSKETDNGNISSEIIAETSNVIDNKSEKINSNFEIINMPRLSDTMEEGTVAKWFKKVGDLVKEGDILAAIETDKATMEFESFYSGHLLHIGIDEGKSAKVDTILAIIGEKEVNIQQVLTSLKNPNDIIDKDNIQKEEIPDNKVEENIDNNFVKIINQDLSSTENKTRIFVSPLAKKIAFEKGLNLAKVKGSGDNGRIIKRDVENYVDDSKEMKSIVSFGNESSEEFPNTQMRKTIAKRLSESKFSAPHYYLGVEFNMDNLISFRIQHNNSTGSKISFNDIILKASAKALKLHPGVNAKWTNEKIVQFNHVHMGFAVAVDDGLVVPVLKFANEMPLQDISKSVKDLAERARSKKIAPSEMEGSTFTISNLGMFGITEFTSIINQPNSAILSVGAILQKPIVKDEKIIIGNTMKLTLACDHRVVDGATGSAFLATLRNFIENPVGILL